MEEVFVVKKHRSGLRNRMMIWFIRNIMGEPDAAVGIIYDKRLDKLTQSVGGTNVKQK